MRRLCICVVMVPSLLFAAAPVQASQISSRKQEARSGAAGTHSAASLRPKRSPVTRAHKYTYGRT
jgi:hypothetical protein